MGDGDYQMALLLQNQLDHEENSNLQSSNDLLLAVNIQDQFNQEKNVENSSNSLYYVDKKNKNRDSTKSLVDPSWEIIDPTPDIHILFVSFGERFFWNKLLSVCVSWSKRMTTCAGICSYQGRGGMCHITLSEPLLKLRPRKDLVETLLHEMIHAYLFVTQNNKDRDGHGPEFQKHMHRINIDSGTNITVYHDFHDEVNLYKQHWWKCDGPCQNWKPYYGTVKRAMNRAPSHNDRWWGEHSRSCGGNFIKVKEPEKKTNPKKEQTKKVTDPKTDIRNFLPSAKNNKENKDVNKIHTITNISGSSTPLKTVVDVYSKNNGFNAINGFHNIDKCSTGNFHTPTTSTDKSKKSDAKNSSSTIVLNTNDNKLSKDQNTETISAISVFSGVGRTLGTSNTANLQDYSPVRNHWLSKFDNVSKSSNKRSSSEDTNEKLKKARLDLPETTTSTKPIATVENEVECPICNKKFKESLVNDHLDHCLKNQKDDLEISSGNEDTAVAECEICNRQIAQNMMLQHVKACLTHAFGDDSFQDPSFEDTATNIKKSSNGTLVPKETEKMEECCACLELVDAKSFAKHLEKCLTKMYDDIGSRNNLDFNKVAVPSKDEASINKKSTCPCCMKLVLMEEMSSHIDICLNTEDCDQDNDMSILMNSFSSDCI